MKKIRTFDQFLNEAKLSKVHKAAKQGSYPAVIVVIQDGKVIHQEPVSTPDVAPATFNVMQKKYPKALLHLEDKTGKRLFSESVVYNSSNTNPIAAKKAKKEFGDLLPKPNKGIKPYVFAVIKTQARNYRLVIKSGSYIAHEFMTNLKDDGILTAEIVKAAVDNIIKLNPDEFNESVVTEKREDVGQYNTVKKVIAKIGRRPSEQEVASFITDNYYDVTEVERGEDDPAANDKIADLVGFYKFDIEDWNIAWADAQNESVVTESEAGSTFKIAD